MHQKLYNIWCETLGDRKLSFLRIFMLIFSISLNPILITLSLFGLLYGFPKVS